MRTELIIEEMPRKTFYWLTPLGYITDKNSKRHWLCRCVCGEFVERRETGLRSGITRSCGCMHPRRLRGNLRPNWSGCGGIHGAYFAHTLRQARKRKFVFNVSKEYLWNLFQSQNGKCALTGIQLTFSNRREVEQTASLDRINSRIGYIEGNVWWVHKDINFMKQEYDLSYYLEMCRLVIENHETSTSIVPRMVA